MITKYLKPTLLIILTTSLVLGSTFAIPAQFQDAVPSKSRKAQRPQQRQEEGQPSPDVLGYWQSLAARSKNPMAVSWNKRSGTPRSIFGKLQGPISGTSEMAARSFLVGNAPLFKMSGDTSDLELTRSQESLIGQHYVFEQRYHGVPVYGSQVAIHFNKHGEIVTVNNTYQPDIELKTVDPQLSQAKAAELAVATLKASSGSKSSAK